MESNNLPNGIIVLKISDCKINNASGNNNNNYYIYIMYIYIYIYTYIY